MARQRKISEERKALIKSLLAEYQPSTTGETQKMINGATNMQHL